MDISPIAIGAIAGGIYWAYSKGSLPNLNQTKSNEWTIEGYLKIPRIYGNKKFRIKPCKPDKANKIVYIYLDGIIGHDAIQEVQIVGDTIPYYALHVENPLMFHFNKVWILEIDGNTNRPVNFSRDIGKTLEEADKIALDYERASEASKTQSEKVQETLNTQERLISSVKELLPKGQQQRP